MRKDHIEGKVRRTVVAHVPTEEIASEGIILGHTLRSILKKKTRSRGPDTSVHFASFFG